MRKKLEEVQTVKTQENLKLREENNELQKNTFQRERVNREIAMEETAEKVIDVIRK